jgi:hypothetical protein
MTKLSRVFNAFLPLWFFLCFEYQAIFSPNQYSFISAFGLILLVIVKFLTTPKNIRGNSLFALGAKRGNRLDKYEKISAAAYVATMIICVFMGAGVAMQMAFIMVILIMAVTFFSLKEGGQASEKKQEETVVKNNFTFNTNFIFPIIFLSFVNYLLSIQIAGTVAFQSIIIVSTLVLADMLFKENKWMKLLINQKVTDTEFKHLLFYRWNRYWSFFLGIWYFLSLRSNGVISQNQSYILIFAFAVIYFIFLVREVTVLKSRELFMVVVFAFFLTALDPMALRFFGSGVADYWQAAIMFVAFDIGNVYFFQSHVEKISHSFWGHKGALYITAFIYILQVHIMMTNPDFTLQSVYSKIILTGNSQEIYSSVIQTPSQFLLDKSLPENESSFVKR